MRFSFVLSTVVVCLGLLWSQGGPESVRRGAKQFTRRVVVSGLANPWEITWGPDNKFWVTERTGKRIVRIDPATGERSNAVRIDEVSAPGGQDGLLGLALHPELLKGTGNDYVYASYTYVDKALGPDRNISDANDPYRFLYLKIVRLTYDRQTGSLGNIQDVITGLPAGNDHVGGRIKIGPDGKLYLTLGDQGHGQFGNFCFPIESQRLPTAAELRNRDYSSYVGKTLRINPDGSVPSDNPKLAGVVSHVWTWGHRNTQGIDFAPDGTLYGAEHGPKTDDEVNVLLKGGNYGWPNVAGRRDNQSYEHARWWDASTPCAQLRFSDFSIHPSVPREAETSFKQPIIEPLAALFTVPAGYNFSDPKCKGVDFICWPTVAVSSIEHYESGTNGIPDWNRVLLVSTLKRGSLYVVHLDQTGKKLAAPIERYFQAENRYRDTAVSPDRRTLFIATDSSGVVEALGGRGVANRMQDPGAILAFTYTGENTGAAPEPALTSTAEPVRPKREPIPGAIAPQFTAAQAAAGRKAYNASCAVCHGNTLRNGAMGTPLAGEYFTSVWSGRSVRDFFDRTHKTMPPAAPASLKKNTYADIVAYILEVNGAKAGTAPLNPDGGALSSMAIP